MSTFAVTLAHPGRLWLLLAVVALAAAHVVAARRRAAALAAYTNPALAHVVAPDRDRRRWARVVPLLLALVGLSTVVVALAEPSRAEAVAREEGVVVLAVDVSASMQAVDIAPDRLAAAIAGATDFVADVPDGIHIGLVAFDGGARLVVAPTLDHDAVLAAVEALQLGPGTAAGEGLYTAIDAVEATLSPELLASDDADLPASIVLLSDGATTVGRPVEQAAAAAAEARIPVTAIAFGTPAGSVVVQGERVSVPADTAAMQAVADATGGRSYEATTAGQLQDVYTDIQTAIGTTTEDRPVSRPLLGFALVLTTAAATVAVATTARPL